ncbi:MAG: hypothetical protein H6Q23_2089 [Bacteroidetes bacterium]|nr:hypothetical protein [Bacteroidota bacterium]
MLHDPGSYSPPVIIDEIRLTEIEKSVLRKLGEDISKISALPIHREKAQLWTSLNDLKSIRPMVWINEIPWHEMNVSNELTLKTINPWAREFEQKLRREIYQWNHMPGDMIVNNYLECPLAIHSTDFGIVEDVDIVRTDEKSEIYSRHFHKQIKEPEDIEKIKMPRITHYEKTTEVVFETMNGLFKNILPVKKVAQTHIWFTPWDYLIRWWGIEEAMIDLIMRPDMVNAAVERMTDAWICELDQFVESKISVSPWADLDIIVREVGDKYVLSIKPSPAIFASDNWDPQSARSSLENVINKTRGISHVELIMKDISTVGYHPEHLWEWEKIAMDVVENARQM